jgi:hypothetical protein
MISALPGPPPRRGRIVARGALLHIAQHRAAAHAQRARQVVVGGCGALGHGLGQQTLENVLPALLGPDEVIVLRRVDGP